MNVRALIISLAIANTLLVAWNVSQRAPDPALSTRTQSTVEIATTTLPGITLLAEANAAEAEPPESVPTDVPNSVSQDSPGVPDSPLALNASPAQCFTIGPLLDRAELTRTRERLIAYTQVLNERLTETLVDTGYWVYLPATEERGMAVEQANELASMGVNDYFVVTSGANANTVSLGLFGGRENAEKRQQEIRALGYDAQIQARRSPEQRYWVDYQLKAGMESPWRYVLRASPSARRLELACDNLNLPDQPSTGAEPAINSEEESVVTPEEQATKPDNAKPSVSERWA